jgi:hypothetical protein
MRSFYLGTGMLIGSVVFIMPALLLLGFSRPTTAIVGIAISTIGFVLQMYAMFSLRASFEREIESSQKRHEAVMEKAKTLPPEEAIKLLLKEEDEITG